MSEMLEEVATVARVQGDVAWVVAQRRSACGGCSAARQCGSGVLSALLVRRSMLLPVANALRAEVGDAVIIGLPGAMLLRAALSAYLLPLLVALAVALSANLAGFGDGATALAAGSGLSAGMGLAALLLRNARRASAYRPTLLRRAEPQIGVAAISCKP